MLLKLRRIRTTKSQSLRALKFSTYLANFAFLKIGNEIQYPKSDSGNIHQHYR
jgi:hypothetical protein